MGMDHGFLLMTNGVMLLQLIIHSPKNVVTKETDLFLDSRCYCVNVIIHILRMNQPSVCRGMSHFLSFIGELKQSPQGS